MGHAPAPAGDTPPAQPQSRFRRIIKKIWWLHSFGALGFGVGVMLFARSGLKYADKVMMALFGSWLLVFIALRFVVGPANRRPDEKVIRRGVRVVTNYVIKQFYQQMFFFLVPLYGASATWSLSSPNWWLAPILLVCGVLSTLDLIFDHFIMERRWLAAVMYGFAMFGVLNVLVPLVFGMTHLMGLYIAAAATPIGVALLTFSVRTVMSPQGVVLTILATAGLLGAVALGRVAIPPAPLSLTEMAVGHGTEGSEECLPASKHTMRIPPGDHTLERVRCGSFLREPGGLKEPVVHVWRHNGRELAQVKPEKLGCDAEPDGGVYRSYFPPGLMPADATGKWSCTAMTEGGQLVGMRKFVVKRIGEETEGAGAGSGSGSGSGTGSGSGSGSGSGRGSGSGSGGGSGSGRGSGSGTGSGSATGSGSGAPAGGASVGGPKGPPSD